MNLQLPSPKIKAKWLLLFVFSAAICQSSFAQSNNKIDSLLFELKTADADTGKVLMLIQLGRLRASAKDKTNSIQHFNEALSLAQKIAFDKGEAMAYYELGLVYGTQGNYAEARENYTVAQNIYRKLNDTKGVASTYMAIGITHKNVGNYPEALKNQLLALEIFEKLHEKRGIASAHLNIGVAFKVQGNYDEALKNYQQSLMLVQELDDKVLTATLYANIGNVLSQQGDFPDALKNHMAALKIHQELGNRIGVASVYNSIGNIYAQTNDYPHALKNYQESLEIMTELDINKGMSTAHNNIGTIHKNLGHSDEAIFHFHTALKISEEINDKKGIAQAQHALGNLYLNQGHFDEAKKCYFSSLKIAEEIGSKDQLLFSYNGIGLILIKHGCHLEDATAAKEKFYEAVDYYKKGLSLAQEIGSKDVKSKFYEALSEAYKLLDNYPLALDYLTRHIALRDSIRNDENNRQLEQLRTQYEVEKAIASEKVQQDLLLNEQRLITERERAVMNARNLYHQQEIVLLAKEKNLQQLQLEKNEANLLAQQALTQKKESDLMVQKAEADKNKEQLALLNKEREVQELKLKKEKLTKNYFIGGLALFLVLSFFIYKNYHTRQEVKLLTLRNKIAIDLHDDVGSTLSSISMFSQMAQAQSKEVIPALETISDSSRKMLDAMADIVWTIKPENDQFDKVIMRMREFAFELLGAKEIDFEFDAGDDISKINLSMEARKNLYLIFKEATNNMVKYSEASRAKFALKGEKDKLMMVISDNGKGFDTTKESRGNGLENMKKRAVEMGAQLLIDSTPGRGTTIRLDLAV